MNSLASLEQRFRSSREDTTVKQRATSTSRSVFVLLLLLLVLLYVGYRCVDPSSFKLPSWPSLKRNEALVDDELFQPF